jgi:hypothetical protein
MIKRGGDYVYVRPCNSGGSGSKENKNLAHRGGRILISLGCKPNEKCGSIIKSAANTFY